MPDLTVVLQFSEPRAAAPFAEVEIKTADGPGVTAAGTLYPRDMALILDLLDVLKRHRDHYPLARKNRPADAPESPP